MKKGHVVPFSSLPPDDQIENLKKGYFIPWRTVANLGSQSTPMVYDASSKTPGGMSLNDTLARRGQNTVASLLKLHIKFGHGAYSFTTDISMAFNSIKLQGLDYCYQKYLWSVELTAGAAVAVWVIITIIQGVKPAENLMNAGFKRLDEYAEATRSDLGLGEESLWGFLKFFTLPKSQCLLCLINILK